MLGVPLQATGYGCTTGRWDRSRRCFPPPRAQDRGTRRGAHAGDLAAVVAAVSTARPARWFAPTDVFRLGRRISFPGASRRGAT